MEEHNQRDKAHLINLISKRNNNTPNFALLVGAGASASSGIKIASQMIAEWRQQLYEEARSSDTFESWLKKQDWFEYEEEYSILFELVYDQRSQRRVYIENCVKDAMPSWGYIYLANIIAHNYFNVVFTPNFDDLLNEACFMYTDCRPAVCAHDSVVADIRITSARPKIIKLHGDFLYDSIKNTLRETEALEKNMRDKFMQFTTEYGLIVLGYGGNDRSIMDILDMTLQSPGYLPHGLYWCRRSIDKPSKKLERVMRRDNAYWVEIDGFDEFMAELHEGLGLALPDIVRDPYRATTEKLNRFISAREDTKNPIIMDDIKELEEQVKKFVSKEDFDSFVPYSFLGDREYGRGNYRDALTYYQKALIQKTDDLRIMEKMILSYWWTEEFDNALEMSQRLKLCTPSDFRGHWRTATSLVYLGRLKEALTHYNEAIKRTAAKSYERELVFIARSNLHLLTGDWQKALSDVEKSLQLRPGDFTATVNKGLALKKLNRPDEAKQILSGVLKEKKDAEYLRACAFATLGDKKNMLRELKASIEMDSALYKVKAKADPDFTDYHDDLDFRKLVYET